MVEETEQPPSIYMIREEEEERSDDDDDHIKEVDWETEERSDEVSSGGVGVKTPPYESYE